MPPLLVAAIPAVIGAGTAIYAGSQQTKAANKGLAAQQQASNQQLQLQQEQWQRAQDVNQPWMNAGGAALNSLSGRLGLTPQPGSPRTGVISQQGMGGYGGNNLGPGSITSPGAGGEQQDWGSYVQQHPDVAAGYDAYKGGGASGFGGANEGQNWSDWGYQPGLSQDQFAQQFQEKTGQGQGYTVPTSAQAPATGPDAGQEPTFQRPGALPAPNVQRPADVAAPNFQRPQDQPLPTFQRPDQGSFTDPGGPADFQFDASKIAEDPGYQFRQKEAMKQVNAGFGARGLLQSGFALRGAIDRSSDVASQETANAFARQMAAYNANASNARENRNFSYNAFNNDRNNTNTNFNSDRGYGIDLALNQQQRGDNIFAQDRAYGTDASRYQQGRTDTNFANDRAYDTNLWQYNNDNQTHNFESDRGYQTGREDTRTGNLFQLAGMGQNAANSAVGAGSNFANNAGNIYGSQANATADAANARAGANAGMVGAVGGAIASGVNRYNWGGLSPATAVGTESISRMPVQTNVSGLNVFNPGRVF